MSFIYAAITAHGYGHGARTAYVLREIRKQEPDVRIILNTALPPEFLGKIIPGEFELRNIPLDVGIVQSDSLNMDLEATLNKLKTLQENGLRIAEEEGAYLRSQGNGVVFGDIPSLATMVAGEAGFQSFLGGNFGWDYIYDSLGGEFEDIASWFRMGYRMTDLLFRYPFHEPMNAFPRIVDVGLPGSGPTVSPDEVRKRLGLRETDRCIFMVFGGMGVAGIPYDNIDLFDGKRLPKRTFITYDRKLIQRKENVAYAGDLIAPDILQISDLVFTKAGFGILADAYGSGTPLITVERKGFAEVPHLNRGLADHFSWKEIGEKELFSNDWSFLIEEFPPFKKRNPIPLNGNEIIGNRLLQAVGLKKAEGPGPSDNGNHS